MRENTFTILYSIYWEKLHVNEPGQFKFMSLKYQLYYVFLFYYVVLTENTYLFVKIIKILWGKKLLSFCNQHSTTSFWETFLGLCLLVVITLLE